MKRLILYLAILFPSVLFAQGSQYQSILLGPTGRPAAGAVITVCAFGSTGIPCQSPINLFSDPGLSIPMTNPTKSDSLGNWGFWALPNNYVYTVTGVGITANGPFTISVPCNLNSSCSGTTSTFAGLPVSPVTNALAIVTDGTGLNCNGGGGAIRELCQWNGTIWVLISGGGGNNLSGMTAGQVPLAATSNTVISSVPASTTVNGQSCALGSTCTVTTGSATAPFISTTSPSASSGTVRMANNESGDCWRNAANTGDVCLTVDTSNQFTAANGNLPVADLVVRGPNPGGVDIRRFGARAINPSAIPSPTTTITSGTSAAVVSSNTGLQIGDGFAIAGAGLAQTMTTPAAPTVTPSCAAGPTGLGFTVPAGAGGTSYAYSASLRDQGQGLTAASPNGTTSTGNASLGANSTAWTSSASGSSNVFTATVGSTANLAAGCLVVLKSSTGDAEFGGWKIITSVVDGTHFTYTSGVDASRGISTTTVTGGTVSYWLCNHVVLPTPGAGGTQYAIYGRTAGSMGFLQMSLLANLGYTDPTYNTFDDYGSPMMDSGPRPWFVPTTPPVSATNDTLVTTITNIVSTTLTLANNASTSVASALSRFDNAPNIAAALTATNSTSVTGAGGTIRFPVAVENSGTGNYCFVTSSYIVATVNAIIQDGAVCPGDTIQLTGVWNGTDNSAARLVQPTNSQRPHIPILIQGANPGIFVKSGGGLNKVSVSMTGNGGIGVFNAQMNNAQVFEDDNFFTGLTNDYMSIAFYDYQSSVSGGFGGKMRNTSWAGGPDNVTVGRTATPIFATKFSLEWDFDYVSCYARGYSFVPFNAGLLGNFHMGEECQGNIMPIVMVTPATVGNTSGSFKISQATNDTGPAPLIANLGPLTATTNADITIEGGNLPSAGQPLISGSPFLGSVFLSGLSPGSQVGQNTNLTVIGRNANFTAGLKTASINKPLLSGSGNHTLVANEGGWNSTGTGTVTIDCTLKGQEWVVYSQSGTTTLACNSGILYGNGATGSFVLSNGNGVVVDVDNNGNAHATGGGGGAGGCAPGGTTDAIQYNGGGACSFGAVNSPTVNGSYLVGYRVTAGAAVPPTIALPGIAVNPQTGTTYTEGSANTDSDRGYLVTASNVGAQTYTMGNPSATGFGSNYFNVLRNIGAGAVTENASGFFVNGGASLLVPPAWTRFLWSDGVNYLASRFPDYTAFPTSCTTALTVVAGVFSCGGAGTVSGVTGDAGLFCNVGSTGSVTLTPCATTLAHKFWGNNTGSTGTASFLSIGKADLPATTVSTDQANTYGAFLQDFSAGTWKFPSGAGATASATNTCTLDTTNKNIHCYINNADAIVGGFASAPANNNIVVAAVSGGNVLLSGTTAIPNGTTATTQTLGDNTTKIATDAFVLANAGSGNGGTITGSGLTTGSAYYNIGGTLTPANAYGIPSALTVTFTNGSANIASVGNTLIVGAAVQFQTTGSLPTNFSTATTYYVITSGSPFTVSATYGGSAVSAGSAGSGTQTLTIVPTLVTNPAYCVASSATVCVFSGPVTGLSGFTAGQAVYVSDATSGALTNTNPASVAGSSGHFVQRIGVATSTTAILVTISPDVATVQ